MQHLSRLDVRTKQWFPLSPHVWTAQPTLAKSERVLKYTRQSFFTKINCEQRQLFHGSVLIRAFPRSSHAPTPKICCLKNWLLLGCSSPNLKLTLFPCQCSLVKDKLGRVLICLQNSWSTISSFTGGRVLLCLFGPSSRTSSVPITAAQAFPLRALSCWDTTSSKHSANFQSSRQLQEVLS